MESLSLSDRPPKKPPTCLPRRSSAASKLSCAAHSVNVQGSQRRGGSYFAQYCRKIDSMQAGLVRSKVGLPCSSQQAGNQPRPQQGSRLRSPADAGGRVRDLVLSVYNGTPKCSHGR